MIELTSVGYGFCPDCLTITPKLHDMGGEEYFNSDYTESIFDKNKPEFWEGLSNKDARIISNAVIKKTVMEIIDDIIGNEEGHIGVSIDSSDGCILGLTVVNRKSGQVLQSLQVTLGTGGTPGQFYLVLYDSVTGKTYVSDITQAYSEE